MAQDKTKTIKKRRIDVYLPTLETKQRWQKEAEKRRSKVSEMVFQIVEAALQEGWEDAGAQNAELEKQVEDLTEDLAALRKRVRELETLNERMEKDLAEYRAQAFLGGDPVVKLDPRLVRALSEARGVDGRPRAVTAQELRKSLRVSADDTTQSKALAEQLEFMELHQTIRKTDKGWVWNG